MLRDRSEQYNRHLKHQVRVDVVPFALKVLFDRHLESLTAFDFLLVVESSPLPNELHEFEVCEVEPHYKERNSEDPNLCPVQVYLAFALLTIWHVRCVDHWSEEVKSERNKSVDNDVPSCLPPVRLEEGDYEVVAEPSWPFQLLKFADQIAKALAILEHPSELDDLQVDKLALFRPVMVGDHSWDYFICDESRIEFDGVKHHVRPVPIQLGDLPRLIGLIERMLQYFSRYRRVLLNQLD